jgi:hypothetical protein
MNVYSKVARSVTGIGLVLSIFVCTGATIGVIFHSTSSAQNIGAQSATEGRPQLSAAPQPEAFVLREEQGEVSCRRATPEEARAMVERDSDQRLQEIAPPSETLQPPAGLKIILRGTTQLDGFPAAKNAFLKAAQTWEALIRNPITIVIDVDYGPAVFGQPFEPGTVGSTMVQFVGGPNAYPVVRASLLARASSAEEAALYNLLPNATLPTDLGSTAVMLAPSPLFRAMGLLNPVADPDGERAQFGPPSSIGFNSAVNFDFDPANGIDAGKIDFDGVAFHEIGHAMGFSSAVGFKEADPDSPLLATLWDLFRFRPGVANATFGTAQRILSSGGNQIFFDGNPELALSTSRPDGMGGDMRQASHWKDDTLSGVYIGVMDPHIRTGDRNLTTTGDLRALDAMGYQLRTSVTQQTAELKTDDGTVEGGIRNDGLIVVNRLTPPSYPATLQTIRIQFRTFSGQPDPTGKPISLVYFTDATGVGSPPAGAQLTRVATTVPGTSATNFFDFAVTNGPTINAGDFYVGFAAPTPNQGVGFPLDTNSTLQARTFLSLNDGTSFLPAGPPQGTTSANAMIRAVVSGTTSTPTIEVAPASLDYGNINVNATADRLLTIRNTGAAILNVTGITRSNPRFSVVAVSNSFVIAPGGQEAVTVRFSPNAPGAQTGALAIASNDPARATVAVQLSGTGGGIVATRTVRTGAAAGSPGGTVAVPIELISQGDENTVGFSLTFDQGVLSNPQAALGTDAAGGNLLTNNAQAAQGRFGVGVGLGAGQRFNAGTRQLAVITFTIAAGAMVPSTLLGFGDQPIAREVVNVNATPLVTVFTGGPVTIAQGFEADVSPRPSGNGSVTVADWVQVGRFVAGLDTSAAGGEFQRADCAPRDSKGNGSLSVADWVQAGRYAAGLDALVGAGGPAGPALAGMRNCETCQAFSIRDPFRLADLVESPASVIRAAPAEFKRGRMGSIVLELDAQGSENALGFTLEFDPAALRFVSARLGEDAAGTALQLNANQAANGRVGIALALPAGQSLASGTRKILTLTFIALVREGGDSTAIRFGDELVGRGVADANAGALRTRFVDGSITFTGARGDRRSFGVRRS